MTTSQIKLTDCARYYREMPHQKTSLDWLQAKTDPTTLMEFTGRYRREIKDRDNHTCVYCGQPAETLDHVIPKSKEGQTVEGNLVVACSGCNLRKGDKNVWEWYSQQPFYTSERWNRIKEITGYDHFTDQTH